MLIKIFSSASIGLLLGYLSGDNLDYSGAMIRLSLVVILLSVIFLLISKNDVILKKLLKLVLVFMICFIAGNIRTAIIKSEFESQKFVAETEVKVLDVKVKDSTKIIMGEVADFENFNESSNLKIKDRVLVYSFTQETINPDDILKINGNFQNKLIILPEKDDGQSNSLKSFNLMDYWRARGVNYLSMYPKITKDSDKKLENSSSKAFHVELSGHSLSYYSYIFRDSFYGNLEKVMDNKNAGLIMAMLWGDESHISKETNNQYRDAGISHILVLSGYNLIIVAALASFLFKTLSVKYRILLSFLFLFIFMVVAETSSPVWRAAIMVSYAFLAVYFNRQSDSRLIIWLTGLIFIAYSSELAMNDISFHMSFLATLSIIYFYPLISKFLERLFDIESLSGPTKALINVSNVTISANILISPYILFQFGYFKLIGMFLSIFSSFLIPIIMLSGFLSGVFGYLSPLISKVFGVFGDVSLKIVNLLVDVVYSYKPLINTSLSFTGLLICYLLLTVVFIFGEFYLKISDSSYKNIDTKN